MLSVLFMHSYKTAFKSPLFTPHKTPSCLFSLALKWFEQLTYKFVTLSIYEFYAFLGQSIIVKYIFHALHGILVWIHPLGCAPSHFSREIIVIKLILVYFDGHKKIQQKIKIEGVAFIFKKYLKSHFMGPKKTSFFNFIFWEVFLYAVSTYCNLNCTVTKFLYTLLYSPLRGGGDGFWQIWKFKKINVIFLG